MAARQAEFETTSASSLTRMSARRSVGVGMIIIAAAVAASFLAVSIVSAFG